jgi:post-segregation antitoxin (ccd killing protein)
MHMPNRTIYLPDELDEMSRQLGLNLSKLTQQAIEDFVEEHSHEAFEARVDAASARASSLSLSWKSHALHRQRDEAGER